MAKSHSHRSHHIQTGKPGPAAPPPESPPPPPAVVEERESYPNLRIALMIWLLGFVALLTWVVFDLLLGLLS